MPESHSSIPVAPGKFNHGQLTPWLAWAATLTAFAILLARAESWLG